MTAIVCVLNKHAAAIAADSAVTIDGKKVFNSANKLFALSKHAPVSISVYNNTELCSVPWEIIIKEYRKELSKKEFVSLHEYADDFFAYIKRENYFSNKNIQIDKFGSQCSIWLEAKYNECCDANRRRLTKDDFERILNEELKQFKTNPPFTELADLSEQSFETEASEIYKQCNERFVKFGISFSIDFIKSFFYEFSKKKYIVSNMTGLVFCGYGKNDIYPSYYSYRVAHIVAGKLVIVKEECSSIGYDVPACICPFAQTDVMHTIIRGISPNVKTVYQETMKNMVGKTLKAIQAFSTDEDFKSAIEEFINQKLDNFSENSMIECDKEVSAIYTQPFVNSIVSLDKEDLAEFAESLIKLTSLKRKISPDQTTVGGPIDVMVISKGDGLVWIKRKQYFDADLNRQFIHNYFND